MMGTVHRTGIAAAMHDMAQAVLVERIERLSWVSMGRGWEPLIEGHWPAEVVGEQTDVEREWFGRARVTVKPSNDGVILPAMSFRCGK